MSGLGPTSTPALCRLCRRPIPRATIKCPYCRARLVWVASAARPRLLARRAGRLKLTGLTAAVAAGVALLVIWGWVLWEVKAPGSSTDTARTAPRPTSADCSSLSGVLTGGPEARITPEIRDKFRQCFQRR
jgi:hypothetical protein